MNDSYRKSLVSKIVSKGIITPFEAIHLQHLNNQHRRQQMANLELSENIYEDYEKIEPLVPDYLLDRALSFPQKQDGDLYNAYRLVCIDLTNLEIASGEIGYKGLALLNEIQSARNEWCLNGIRNIDLGGPTIEKLMEYKTYSYVNQKHMTFTEILESLGITISILMVAIDVVLTDNYYLENLFDLDELNCLKYLKMWIKGKNYDGMTDQEKEDEWSPFDNLIGDCFKGEGMYFIFDKNHSKMVELMRNKISSCDLYLPSNFEQNSLDYVKETVKTIVETNAPPSLRIADLHEPSEP